MKVDTYCTQAQLDIIGRKIGKNTVSNYLRMAISKRYLEPCVPCKNVAVRKSYEIILPEHLEESLRCEAESKGTTVTEHIRRTFIEPLFLDEKP